MARRRAAVRRAAYRRDRRPRALRRPEAAAAPQWVRRDEVPAEVVQKELEIAKAQMRDQKKPEAILDAIDAVRGPPTSDA